MTSKKVIQNIIFLVIIFSPCLAQANAGVPMGIISLGYFIFALIPIIGIEAYYLSKTLNLKFSKACDTATQANLFSTFLGIPLTWGFLVFAQISTGGSAYINIKNTQNEYFAFLWQVPWLFPNEEKLGWMIPAAFLILLIPFYFVTWWSEYWFAKKIHKEISKTLLLKKVRNANLITYFFMAIWQISELASELN